MTWWRVTVRGIGHRAGRSAVVALLAAVAVATAVLAPSFSRAAEQSVLTDGLSSARPAAAAITIGASGTAGSSPAAHSPTGDARRVIDAALADLPTLAGVLQPAVAGVDTSVTISGDRERAVSRLAYRDQVCQQLDFAGACPISAGEVLVSTRTAAELDIDVGDALAAEFANAARELTVTGIYRPGEEPDGYWARTVYFVHGGFDPATGALQTDAIFTPAEPDVQADPDAVVDLAVTYSLQSDAVELADVATLRAELAALHDAVRIAELAQETSLLSILDDIADDQEVIRGAVPVIAVPLLLLAWFVLFLLVSALTEERGREVALAKLRGFPVGRAAGFGLAEVLLLIVAAAGPGVLLGLGLTELASRMLLAEGTHAQLRAPVLVAAAIALAAAAVAAVLAARGTLGRGVLALLRQVPARGRWRAGVLEGMVLALAAASLITVLGDRESPLALLTPALLALVAGIVAARLVWFWSALRLRLARRRGRIPALLSAAQLSRRPIGRRIVALVTVAVALLSFAAASWDVAAQARHDHAVDSLGADRVYSVDAEHPAALLAAVEAADPSGTAMAVVRSRGQYAEAPVELLGVQTSRWGPIAQWRGFQSGRGQIEALRPLVPEPLRLAGEIEVSAEAVELGQHPVRLSALVSQPGQPPQAVSLGTLRPGAGDYAAALPRCMGEQCRLLGLVLGRSGAVGAFTAQVQIQTITTSDGPVAARFDQPQAWQPAEPDAATVTAGSSLLVEVSGAYEGDVVVWHHDSVAALPAVLAGPAPAAEPDADRFDFPGFSERPEPFAIIDTADRLPRAGERGLLFDLELAVGVAERRVGLADRAFTYEVWAAAAAPDDLAQRLAGAGVGVQSAQSMSETLDALSRRAPGLSLWLYLLAAVAAVTLALGTVVLSGHIGAAQRLHELAALRVTGVGARLLRRSLLREYAALLGWPLLVGFGTGIAAAALMLPGMALVEVGVETAVPAYRFGLGALPVAAVATVAALLVAGLYAVRLPGRATADRLRQG